MLAWAITLLIIGVIVATIGFTGIAGVVAGIGRVLFFFFIILFILALISGIVKWPRKKRNMQALS